jgi:hypothetical protein
LVRVYLMCQKKGYLWEVLSSVFMWVTYYREIRLLLVFFSPSRQKPEYCVQLSYKQFLLNPFHIILPFEVA